MSKTLFIDPVKNNLTIMLSLLGIALLFMGAVFGEQIEGFVYSPKGSADMLLKAGSAILGAGIFAALMKSAQFSEIFQKHIYEVFYCPEKVIIGLPLISKWKILTNSLLKEVLPCTYHQAADRIQAQFFNSELDYHFENYTASYRIRIENNIAMVNCIITTTLIISPLSKNPILKQSIQNNDNITLKTLILNDIPCLKSYPYTKDINVENKYNLNIPLKKHIRSRENGENIIELERVVEWKQDLSDDPCIVADIRRYIKGAKVKIKIDDDYKVQFKKFGLEHESNNNYVENDGVGYQRWTLVESDNLLLPGQSYIIVMIPLNTENK